MSVETAMRIRLASKPGEIARVTRILSDSTVSLRAVAAVDNGVDSTVEFLVDDPDHARQALNGAGEPFEEVRVVVAWMPNHPGALYRACAALAAAEINLAGVYLVASGATGQRTAFNCSDCERADRLLTTIAY